MDGLEFLQKKAADSELGGVPVVVVSAVPDGARGMGAVKLVKKPINIDALEHY